MALQLRDYQQKAIDDTYNYFKHGVNRIMIALPTGSGKSICITKIALDAQAQGKRVLIIAHRTKLVRQLSDTISKFTSFKVATITAKSKKKINHNSHFIYVGMAQTLAARELPPDIDLVILDECHTCQYLSVAKKLMDKYFGPVWDLSKTKLVGMTASPWRTKNKEGFCLWYKAIVRGPSPFEMVDNGYLTRPYSYSYAAPQLDQLKDTKATDYSNKQLSQVCTDEYNQYIVDKFDEKFDNPKTIAFCVTVAQAEDLAKRFTNKGYHAEVVDGSMAEGVREDKYQRFKEGSIRVLVSIATLTTGYDETSIEAVLIARPTKSVALLCQMIGRGLRLHPGKDFVYILDFGDCFSRITKVQDQPIVDHANISYSTLCPYYFRSKQVKKKCREDQGGCGHWNDVFAKVCTKCGKSFSKPSGSGEDSVIVKEEKPMENYDFLPFMTVEATKRFKFIRRELRKCFEKRESPKVAYDKYFRKFTSSPPNDYSLGAVLDFESTQGHYKAYVSWMKDAGVGIKEGLKYMQNEFGEPGRTYLVHGQPYRCSDKLSAAIDKHLNKS